jgi:hypothetical protein
MTTFGQPEIPPCDELAGDDAEGDSDARDAARASEFGYRTTAAYQEHRDSLHRILAPKPLPCCGGSNEVLGEFHRDGCTPQKRYRSSDANAAALY